MSCKAVHEENRRVTTLPPPCCHVKPPPFCCPKYGCPPPQQCPPRISRPRSFPEPRLNCRSPPEEPAPPPTICVAGPCPHPSGETSRPRAPCSKIPVPPSCVRFCILTACGRSTYYPYYSSSRPKCPGTSCC